MTSKLPFDVKRITESANRNGWLVAERQPDRVFLRFVKDEKILDIWYRTMTARFIEGEKNIIYRDNSVMDIEELLEKL